MTPEYTEDEGRATTAGNVPFHLGFPSVDLLVRPYQRLEMEGYSASGMIGV